MLHFICKSRSQSLEEEWRDTESMLLEVQCEVFTVSDDLGCHVICWCWSTVFSEVHSQRSHLPGNFKALHASFCWRALSRCWFHFFSRTWHLHTLLKVPKAGSMTMVLLCLIGQQTRLTWTPLRIYGVLSRGRWTQHQIQQCRWPEGRYFINLGFITPEQCRRLIASMPRCIDAVIHAKGGPTKYWVHRNEHTFQKPDISV